MIEGGGRMAWAEDGRAVGARTIMRPPEDSSPFTTAGKKVKKGGSMR